MSDIIYACTSHISWISVHLKQIVNIRRIFSKNLQISENKTISSKTVISCVNCFPGRVLDVDLKDNLLKLLHPHESIVQTCLCKFSIYITNAIALRHARELDGLKPS
jgi:hypothetical protein